MIEKERDLEKERDIEKDRDIEKERDVENAEQTDRERKKDSMLNSGGPRKIKNLPNLHLLRICFLLLLNFVYTK